MQNAFEDVLVITKPTKMGKKETRANSPPPSLSGEREDEKRVVWMDAELCQLSLAYGADVPTFPQRKVPSPGP